MFDDGCCVLYLFWKIEVSVYKRYYSVIPHSNGKKAFYFLILLLFVLKQKVTKNSRIYKLAALKQYIFIAYARGSTKV